MKKKFIAYSGEKFTIEWYYDDKGKSSVFEFYQDLSSDQKDKLLYLFIVLATKGTIRNEEKFRNEGDKIFAFKPAPDRFLCFFFEGRKVIVTNAYKKQKDKMPVKEKDKALKAKNDYEKRRKTGSYYE